MAKKSFKERLAAARSRGGPLLSRLRPLGMAGAAGGAGQFIEEFAGDKMKFVGDNWYGGPVVLGVGAFVAGQTRIPGKDSMAAGLAGAAGYAAAFNWKLKEFQEGKRKTSPVRNFAKKAETKAETKGDDDDTGLAQNDTGYSMAGTFEDVGDDDDDTGFAQNPSDFGTQAPADDEADVQSAFNLAMQGPGNPWGI